MAQYRFAEVAVKQIIGDSIREQEVEDFWKEASTLATLAPHPNVIDVIGISKSPPMIVTAFMPKGSLLSFLQIGNVEPDLALEIVRGVAAGMTHLHKQGVVHRDLAARNVLLSESLKPKIADFGLSRDLGEGDEGKTTSDIGPVRWMAPESLKERRFSRKSDVWSFGVLLWEVATNGKTPYEGMQVWQVASEVYKGALNLEVPLEMLPSMANVMRLCMRGEAEQRPEFAEVFRLLEERDLEGESVQDEYLIQE